MPVLEELHAAYNRHDVDAVGALYAADGTHEDVAYGRPKQGRGAIAGGLSYFLKAFPDARWVTFGSFEDGERAMARYVLTGTLQSDFGPFKAGGQRIELRGVQVLELSDGLIVRSEDYWDGATFERQARETKVPVGPEGEAV
jgi:steroid delta-isomerase-like uncharacterized protein